MSSYGWTARPKIPFREQPERLAWAVLLSGFAIFCLLAVGIPASIFYFIEHGALPQSARLDPTLGTLQFRPSRSAEIIAVTDASRDDVGEGSRIVAGSDSTQGTISFVSSKDAALIFGSVQIYAGTSIEILRIREPIFERSQKPYWVRLELMNGQARVFNNSGESRDLRVELKTPHGVATMDVAGAYKIQVTDERTDITVRTGAAQLSDQQGSTITITESKRAWLSAEGLTEALPSEERNLIRNGDFQTSEDGTPDPWLPYVDGEAGVSMGTLQYINSEGRQVLFFSRQEGENYHTEVGVVQEIGKQVNVYDALIVQFDVKLLHQKLAGAGERGSEFPLRVEISYTDIYGKIQTWGHGFYYLDPRADEDPGNDLWSTANGEIIPQGQWFSYVSPNLMDVFQERGTPPATIDQIRLYASGHKYQSIISGVDLLAR